MYSEGKYYPLKIIHSRRCMFRIFFGGGGGKPCPLGVA